MTQTTVHLVRHGEVYNPEGILYGRRPGFHLTERGHDMARLVAGTLREHDITHLVASPLERTQETAAPIAEITGLEIESDPRVIESTNKFEGWNFGRGARTILENPRCWPWLRNPLKPSWGEPYDQVTARMMSAVRDARDAARGHEAVIVSHQLPIWITRLAAEGRSYLHNPKQRQCAIGSLTSLHFRDDVLTHVSYAEPAAALIPEAEASLPFSVGGASEEKKPI